MVLHADTRQWSYGGVTFLVVILCLYVRRRLSGAYVIYVK